MIRRLKNQTANILDDLFMWKLKSQIHSIQEPIFLNKRALTSRQIDNNNKKWRRYIIQWHEPQKQQKENKELVAETEIKEDTNLTSYTSFSIRKNKQLYFERATLKNEQYKGKAAFLIRQE